MILTGGILELSTITRKQSSFDATDVADTRLFISELEPEELVFPYGISDHMLYYADISRGNIVADLRVKQDLLGLLDHDSVYEVSDLIHGNYPDVCALVFYMDSWDEHSLREKPFGRLLDIYFERKVYGDFSSYRLEIPFTVDKLKMKQIKYVEDLPGGLILGSVGDIVAVSNCIYSSGDESPYIFLFLREASSDLSTLTNVSILGSPVTRIFSRGIFRILASYSTDGWSNTHSLSGANPFSCGIPVPQKSRTLTTGTPCSIAS